MALLALTTRHLRELRHLHPTLLDILIFAADHWPVDVVTVTSIYRTTAEEDAAGGKSGIHMAGPPYRAVDLRIRDIDGGAAYNEADQVRADKVAALINEKWVYDPSRREKRVAVSMLHGSGPHLHLQCSNTTRPSYGLEHA